MKHLRNVVSNHDSWARKLGLHQAQNRQQLSARAKSYFRKYLTRLPRHNNINSRMADFFSVVFWQIPVVLYRKLFLSLGLLVYRLPIHFLVHRLQPEKGNIFGPHFRYNVQVTFLTKHMTLMSYESSSLVCKKGSNSNVKLGTLLVCQVTAEFQDQTFYIFIMNVNNKNMHRLPLNPV